MRRTSAAWQAAGEQPTVERQTDSALHRGARRDRRGSLRLRRIGPWPPSTVAWAASTTPSAWRRSTAETRCRRCNTMVWSEGSAPGAGSRRSRGGRGSNRASVVVRRWRARRRLQRPCAPHRGRAGGLPGVGVARRGGGEPSCGRALATRWSRATSPTARAIGAVLKGSPRRRRRRPRPPASSEPRQPVVQAEQFRLRQIAVHQARGDLDAAAPRPGRESRSWRSSSDGGPRACWPGSPTGGRAGARPAATTPPRTTAPTEYARARRRQGPWPPLVVAALEVLASVAVARDSHTEGARLHGAAAHVRDEIGYRYDIGAGAGAPGP